jgi:acetone carboxylase gamma subunit
MFPCRALKTFDQARLNIQHQKYLDDKRAARAKLLADFKSTLQKQSLLAYNQTIDKCEQYYVRKGKFPKENSFKCGRFSIPEKLQKHLNVVDINEFLREINPGISISAYHWCENPKKCVDQNKLNEYEFIITIVYPISEQSLESNEVPLELLPVK